MKTLFILVSMMVVLFLAAPDKVEAQKRKVAAKTMVGIVTGLTGNKHWFGYYMESGGKEYVFTTEYNDRQGRNPKIIGGNCCEVGTRVKVTNIGSDTGWGLNVTLIVILGH